MNTKLRQEREKARQLLKDSEPNVSHLLNAKSTSNFDWSDLKIDKTQFFVKTPNRSDTNSSPFEDHEITARSTAIRSKALDFDELMKSSMSAAVQNKYRESMAQGRLSVAQGAASDFNDTARKEFSLLVKNNPFDGNFTRTNNLTYSNEDFQPAEEISSFLNEDMRKNEMEYADIPHVEGITYTNESNWEDNLTLSKQREMSFGQYCNKNVNQFNIRDIYGGKSPPKRQNRVPLIDVSTNDTNIKKSDSQNLEELIRNNDKSDKIIGNGNSTMVTEHSFSSSMSEMIEELNFEKIMEKAKLECSRVQSDKENSRIVVDENVPVQDGDHEDSYCMRRADQNRGVKRRPTSACSETPLSTLGKCHRSKSPSYKRDLETAAAAKLKPQIVDDVFKMPRPYDSTLKGGTSSSTTTTREYLTAMESLSIRSPGEKLSLPNYALTRSAHKSPTSSNHSKISHWSPNSSEGKLKRSASQLSTASEFQDDFLPIKIKNSDNRKLSFPSVKVDRSEMKTFSIQNGSDKKLPLRVRIIGAGFSVSPKEDFRMVPLEARTFYVKFSPCVVGPVCGRLIFELTTNKHCAKTIPLYGYGGHSSVQMEGIQKGPFGPPFLTMGTIRDLGMTVEKTIRLSNTGTLPSFVSLAFERTKLSDFVMADSLTMHPMQLRIDPDKFADVKIRFRATKADVRKIVSSNKDVTTIGEIFMISGDEPTRLRILMNKGQVEQKLLSCLPKSLPNEADLQAKLIKFNEDLSKDKLLNIISQIKTHEIALTVNRNLDDTQLLSTEISLADDTQMNFETFIDTNYTRVFSSDGCHTLVDHDNVEVIENDFVRIRPSKIIFTRTVDGPETIKVLTVELISPGVMFLEVVSSSPKMVTAIRSCGQIKFGEAVNIKVSAAQNCFGAFRNNPFLMVLINDVRIEIPIEFN